MATALSTVASNPLPRIRALNPPVNTVYNVFVPSSSSSCFNNCGRVSLRSGRKLPLSVTRIRCGGDSDKVREINETQFRDVVLKSERPVLVEFVATWCGPCRLIAPAIQSIAQEYQDKLTVVKIDHDLNPGLIEEYKVYGLPTLIVFQNGQEVPESRREGCLTKSKLKDYVDELLKSVSVV